MGAATLADVLACYAEITVFSCCVSKTNPNQLMLPTPPAKMPMTFPVITVVITGDQVARGGIWAGSMCPQLQHAWELLPYNPAQRAQETHRKPVGAARALHKYGADGPGELLLTLAQGLARGP